MAGYLSRRFWTGHSMAGTISYRIGSILAVPLMLVLSASAQLSDYERIKPKEPDIRRPRAELPEPKVDVPDDDTVLVPALNAVIFVSRVQDVQPVAQGSGIVTSAVPLLDNDEFRQLLKDFPGKPVSWKSIGKMMRVTILYFRQQDRPVVDVIVPEQDISNGVVQLLVIEARVGEIKVEGNRWFSDELLRGYVRLKKDDVIHTGKLLEDIDYMNQNWFRYVRPVLSPGSAPGTTDLTLDVEDRFPVRFYIGYEDTGTRLTEIGRYVAGFNWGNVFGLDHELGYQFTTNTCFSDVFVHSWYYRIPLPNRHKLSFFGSYSDVQVDMGDDIISAGSNWQVSGRYIASLADVGNYRHEFQGGFDFKAVGNNLEFGGMEVFNGDIDVTQIAIQYDSDFIDSLGSTSLILNGYYSPGHITTRQGKEEYEKARAGTDPEYGYGQLELERVWQLPWKMSLVNRFTGQFSTDRLPVSEQLGFGGYTTVRGYDDREVNADQGVMTTLELRSPDFVLGRFDRQGRLENRVQFLAFWDYGNAINHTRLPGEDKSIQLQSVGVGVRYRIGSNLSARLDYGFRLKDTGGELDNNTGRFHLGVVASY